MTKTFKAGFLLVLLCMALLTACSTIKSVEVWKADTYNQKMGKVLVLAVAEQDYIRKQFENVLANQLRDRGIEVITSYSVLPEPISKLNKEMVIDKVDKLGVDNVLVTSAISKKEITNYQAGGFYFAPSAVYLDGWYSYAVGTVRFQEMAYDNTYLNVVTNLFALGNKSPVWSNLTEVKVEDSRQDAVNKFIPIVVEQLELSEVL